MKASTNDKTVTVLKGTGPRQQKTTFKFDNVFTAFSTQQEVFDATLRPVIRDVLLGYESTVFAYGQTGTGKTHTMEGNLDDPTRNEFGVIPRSAEQIFCELETNPEFISSKVYCSFLEIYNEELCDLLVTSSGSTSEWNGGKFASAKSQSKLAIMEGPNGPFCRGLSEQQVSSSDELLNLMRQAQQQRQVGETNMNKQSSRSHCIFTLKVEAQRQLPDGSTLEVSGKLHCVDLAGSECAKSANLDGSGGSEQAARERERRNINTSLLTLGRVVSTLKELSENGGKSKNKNVRIPYRDSKLTRILQESLGGRCKTCLIATVSPSVSAIEESISTLNYAQAANGIINKPVTTSSMTVGGGSGVGAASMTSAPPGGAASVEHWHEMEVRLQYMQSQVDEAQQALARKHVQHQEFLDRAEKAEAALKLEEEKHQESLLKIEKLQQEVKVATHRADMSEKHLKETRVLLDATRRTEAALTKEATELINHLKTTITAGNVLHAELLEYRDDDIRRREATNVSTQKQLETLETVMFELNALGEKQKLFHANLAKHESSRKSEDISKLQEHQSIVENMKKDCGKQLVSIRESIQSGLNLSFHPFVASVRDGMTELKDKASEFNTDLEQHCQDLNDRLEQQLTDLNSHQSNYEANSNEFLSAVESTFEGSSEGLDCIVSATVRNLRSNLDERNKSSEKVSDALDSWKSTYSQFTSNFSSLASSNFQELNRKVSSFSDQVQNHRMCITEQLDKQLTDHMKQRNAYIKTLEEQNRRLKAQHHAIVNAQAEQERRNKALVENVITKMKATLLNEMQAMTTFQHETSSVWLEQNSTLATGNDALVQTTQDTFDEMDSSTQKMSAFIETSFDVQARVTSELTDDITSFQSEISKSLEQQQQIIDKEAQESRQILESNHVTDQTSTDCIIDALKTDLLSQKRQLESGSQSIQGHITALHTVMNDAFGFVAKDVIKPVQQAVETCIQDRACEHGLTMSSQVDDILYLLEGGEAIMNDEIHQQIVSTEGLEKTINESISQKFITSIAQHSSAIMSNNWLNVEVAKHDNEVLKNLSSAVVDISSARGQAQDLATNIIKVHEEVLDVRDPTVPDYSTTLTATPSDEELLRGLSEDGVEMSTTTKENAVHSKTKRTSSSRPISSLPVLKVRNVASHDDDEESSPSPSASKRSVSESESDMKEQSSSLSSPSMKVDGNSSATSSLMRNKRARVQSTSMK